MYGKKHKMKAKADRMMKINAVKARMAKKSKGKKNKNVATDKEQGPSY